MVRFRFLFLLSVALCMMSSCEKDESKLSIGESQIEFAYTGGSQSVTINCDADWSIYGLQDWLTASNSGGVKSQTITLTATANETSLDRETELFIRTNDGKNVQSLKVVQYGAAGGSQLRVNSTDEIFFNGESSLLHNDSILITSSVRWRISGPSWLNGNFNGNLPLNGELREGSGTIYLYASKANVESESRKDNLIIQSESGNILIKIPVTQLGYNEVKCVNPLILANGFSFNCRYGINVKYIAWGSVEGVWSTEEMSTMTLPRFATASTTTSFYVNLPQGRYYTLCLKGMPSEKQIYKKADTEVFYTPTDGGQPRATLSDLMLESDGKWHYKITMNSLAKGFHHIAYSGLSENASQLAHSYLYNHIYKKSSYVNYRTKDSYFTINADKDRTFFVWAVGLDGELSKVVDIYQVAMPTDSSMSLRKSLEVQYVGTIDADELEFMIPKISQINNFNQK